MNRRAAQTGIRRRVELDPGNIWRVGLVVIGLIVLFAVVRFVLDVGSSLLFTAVMAWFFSLAMEPAVSRLSQRMRRGAATGLVALGVVVFLGLFFALFGQLVVEQVANLVRSVPDLADNLVAWVNRTFGTDYAMQDLVSSIDLSPERAAGVASDLAGGVLAVLGSIAGGIATFFTFALLLFYLSADGPRLRRWIASLFPPALQRTTLVVWDTTAEKTGRYVAARVILAAVNSTASGIVFLVIGLPSWLALALWTGLVAQFVPAIGTYIAIALPVLVGLLSPNPWLGVIVLAWGIVYQQIENLTIEPRISARAVNIHPAVSFASVILGISMFGVAGALLAIPVVAMLLSLLDLYRTRYELLPELRLEQAADDRVPDAGSDDDGPDGAGPDRPQPGATAV
ncbi:MAG: AI-2E family transporter [Actinotalea sp.]|nr:AI-2E family transporter [Actinotalea sp.]